MDGIVTGKVEKSAGALEFKTIRSFTPANARSQEFQATYDGEDREKMYLKLTAKADNTDWDYDHIFIVNLLDISVQDYGGSQYYPLGICFSLIYSNQYVSIEALNSSNRISQYIATIEIGTLS